MIKKRLFITAAILVLVIGGGKFYMFSLRHSVGIRHKIQELYLDIKYPDFEAPTFYEADFQEQLLKVDTTRHFEGVENKYNYEYKYKYKWVGLIPGNNGKLYGIPNDINEVLEIDPVTCEISTFGKLSELEHKYTGGCIDKNGIIWGYPRSAGTLLRIDPDKHTAEEIDLGIPYMSDRFYTGALYENRIYMMPRFNGSILVINIDDYSTYKIDTPDNLFYAGCVLHPNGLIYCIPWGCESQVMVINPKTDKICFIGKTDTYDGFSLVVDPVSLNIYGFVNYSGIVKIDTKTHEVTKLHTDITQHAFYGTELGPNGCMYSVLGHGTVLYEFNPADESIRTVALVSDGIDNAKCAGGCTDKYGNIWLSSAHGIEQYRLVFSESKDTIPYKVLNSPFLGNY